MTIRSTLAVTIGRATRWALHDVLHRSASQLPGRAALWLDPSLIARLRDKARQGTIVVCGTNGKTTTTNLIAATLEAASLNVLCNRDGANMAAGITSALLPQNAADWAVLEADELSTIHVLPQLRPTYLMLLNLFRDQLDRAGEIDHVQDVIVEALTASPMTTLVTCGDDPLCVGIAERARQAGTQVLFFGIDEDLGLPPDRVPEARFCQRCGTALEYAYRSYAQLGAFRCPACGFARPELDFVATGVKVDRAGVSFDFRTQGRGPGRVREQETAQPIHADFGGVYMAYNLLAVAAATALAGLPATALQGALDDYDPGNGRLQHFHVDGREVILNLAKNPTGLNQNLSLMDADERPKAVYVILNDDYNDGRDISWIWDVDFERLAESGNVELVLAGGHRANDLQVRLKYAGTKAALAASVADAIEQVQAREGEASDSRSAKLPLYVLANYSALRPTREELEGMARPEESIEPEGRVAHHGS